MLTLRHKQLASYMEHDSVLHRADGQTSSQYYLQLNYADS